MPTINVRNRAQRALLEFELKGQISDGYWENAAPRDHYVPWCTADAVVKPDAPGCDFWAQRTSYDFTSGTLLEIVGTRMLAYAKLAMLYGFEDARDLKDFVDDSTGELVMPSYQGEYWDKKRAKAAPWDFAVINAKLRAHPYSLRDMRADLKDLKKVFQMRQGDQVIPGRSGDKRWRGQLDR